MNYFLTVMNYQTKNKAHEELQRFVNQWQHALVDDSTLTNLIEGIKDTVKLINAKYPRCQDITLMTQFHKNETGGGIVWVDGNFQISILRVYRTETRDIKQNFSNKS